MRLFLNIKQKSEGTPPRIDGKTIDFSKTERKYPDYPPIPFSFMNDKVWIDSDKQLFTHMTYTNEEVAKIVKDHRKNPMVIQLNIKKHNIFKLFKKFN